MSTNSMENPLQKAVVSTTASNYIHDQSLQAIKALQRKYWNIFTIHNFNGQ